MKLTFRWFGDDDPVTLVQIRQIPTMSGIVSAVYDVPVGEVWPRERIAVLKAKAEAAGLAFEVVESVPVHEEIKLGGPKRDTLINAFIENIRRLARQGVKVICYNFMPVFDWMRSELARQLSDGSTTMAYDEEQVKRLNPVEGKLSLPGWDESYLDDGRREVLLRYEAMDDEALWRSFEYFLSRVIPVCDQVGIKMAIHPDDPPWGIFGLPRIITGDASYERMFRAMPSDANGVTLCIGSLGSNPMNDLPAIISRHARKIHFVHARNVLITGERCFEEAPHPSGCGSLDMYAILKALYDGGFDGYMRPDHGRMVWGETGRPGYGLFDRALGATYLAGLWEAIEKAGRRARD